MNIRGNKTMNNFLTIFQFGDQRMETWYKTSLSICLMAILVFQSSVNAQNTSVDTLTLAYCHNQIDETYPLVQDFELHKKIAELNKKIIRTGNLPQFNVDASVSYQTEMPEVDIPFQGAAPVTVSKDQYSLGVDITQNIYNGGRVEKQQNIEDAREQEQNAMVRVDLHQVKQQINKVYFSILLSKQQMENNNILIEDLEKQLEEIRSKIEHGILLPSQRYIIEAELLKMQQDSVAIASTIQAGYEILAELINQVLSSQPPLKIPDIQLGKYRMAEFRPEYQLFENQRSLLERKLELEKINKLPTISAFGSAAYANPGLDIFDESFDPHLLFGVSLKWDFWKAFNTDRTKTVIRYQQQQIDTQEDAFTKQLRTELDDISNEIEATEENISRDQKIIDLHNKVVKEQSSRLKNGVITSTEYITELNKLSRARVALLLRRVQLAQQKIDYITKIGYSLEN